VNIEQEMRDAFMDYAMSVIVSRALPDARDGLKPVHRRILYAMHDMGLRSDTAYKKSARIVGEVLGKYHPHGDSAVYEAMVRMAQDFAMRYMLVEGQGNYGSIDGDGAAAMRYTEARMARIGEELMGDIDKNTVNFTENFDGSLTEPAVLPASIPNLLVNGATGIAVGMATNIPPHNLSEVCGALIHMLKHWHELDDLSVTDLMQFIKGPDFPTGGLVYRHKDGQINGGDEDTLLAAYATGRGKVTVRAKVHIEDMGRGKSRLIVSELPYQTTKTTLIERIAQLVRDERLLGIADLRDESDRQGMRLVIELQRGAEAADVLVSLFKLTPMEDTFGIIMLALVNNEPRILTLKQALKVYLDHRLEVIKRRSEFDVQRARERAHILEGLLAALDQLDAVIRTIRTAKDVDAARAALIKLLDITEVQAQAILDMQLRRLASLEAKKIQDEYIEKIALIRYLEELLGDSGKMREVIVEELTTLRDSFGDKRRTMIVDSTASTASVADLFMPEEKAWITLTAAGKVARMLDNAAPKVTAALKEPPRFVLEGTTGHILHLIASDGRCATIPVQNLPQAADPDEGGAFNDLCPLPASVGIIAAWSLPMSSDAGYMFMATAGGLVKRVRLADLPGNMAHAFMVMNPGDDKLIAAFPTDGKQEVVLTSNQAQAIRFKESEVRPTGLPAGGMRGIKFAGVHARVVGADIARSGEVMFTISEDGVAKTSALDEYPTQGRAGGGVITMRLPSSSREIAATATGGRDETVVVLSNRGKAVSMRLGRAPEIKRGRAGGDIIFSMSRKGEEVLAVVKYQPLFVPPEPDESDSELSGELEDVAEVGE
jgi:DNA gyrase subunit A